MALGRQAALVVEAVRVGGLGVLDRQGEAQTIGDVEPVVLELEALDDRARGIHQLDRARRHCSDCPAYCPTTGSLEPYLASKAAMSLTTRQ